MAESLIFFASNLLTTEWLKKATALAAAFALAAAALPASAHPVSADSVQDTDRVSGAVNLDSKITFSGSENYGGALDDSFKAIARTKDGGYVAVGYSWAASTDPSWGHVASTNNYAYSDGLCCRLSGRTLSIQEQRPCDADFAFPLVRYATGTIK